MHFIFSEFDPLSPLILSSHLIHWAQTVSLLIRYPTMAKHIKPESDPDSPLTSTTSHASDW